MRLARDYDSGYGPGRAGPPPRAPGHAAARAARRGNPAAGHPGLRRARCRTPVPPWRLGHRRADRHRAPRRPGRGQPGADHPGEHLNLPGLRDHRRRRPATRRGEPAGRPPAGGPRGWACPAGGIGAAVLGAGLLLAPLIVHVFGASPAVTAGAVTYLRISLLGAPAMLTVLAGTGVLRGLQDTRTPLAVAVGASAANIVLNAIFVLGLGWGLAGSAWGTAVVQNAAALTFLAVIARGARRAGVALRPDGAGVRSAAPAGAALVVRTLSRQAVLVVTTALAARMGDAAIAAHQIAFRIWMLLSLALDAIAIAGQAITGKYLGAGDVAGARAATARMTAWGAVYGVVFGAVILAAWPFLPELFAAAPPVAGLLLTVLLVVAVLQPVAGVVFGLGGGLIGRGYQEYLALAGLITAVVFGIAAACVHVLHGGLVALWLAFGVWIAARFVTLTLRARGSAWLVTGPVR